MSEAVQIRKLEIADVDSVLELWHGLMAAGGEADPRYRKAADARDAMRPWIRNNWTVHKPFVSCWIATADNGELVGMITGAAMADTDVLERPPSAMISDMFVVPAFRRRGVARALVTRFVDAAKAAGFARIGVKTLALDERAVAFWKGVGFGDWMVTLVREG